MAFDRNVRVLVLLTSVLITPASVLAEVIWDNGVPLADTGSLASDFRFPSQWAEDFYLDVDRQIARVRWWGQYINHDTPTIDQFTIRIFETFAEGGAPTPTPVYEATPHQVGRINTGPTSFGFNTYAYEASIPATTLDPGTYWLSIVNDTTLDGDDIWYWSRSSSTIGNVHHRGSDGAPWQVFPFGNGSSLAFVLETPEPTVGGWVAMSLLMLGHRRKRSGELK